MVHSATEMLQHSLDQARCLSTQRHVTGSLVSEFRTVCTDLIPRIAAQSCRHNLNSCYAFKITECISAPRKRRKRLDCRAESRGLLQTPASSKELQPVAEAATAFAPATVANLGPGFDWLGCAVDVSSSTLIPADTCSYAVHQGCQEGREQH